MSLYTFRQNDFQIRTLPYSGTSNDFLEGWAEFFQFAARNYISAQVPDEILNFKDNDQEEASFPQPEADPITGILHNKKYVGIRYEKNANAAGFSCMLWNFYDGISADEHGYMSPHFNGRNNDDIDEPARVFQIMKNNSSLGSALDYNNNFKYGEPADFQNSCDRIADFTLGDGSVLMHSAQVTNLFGDVDHSNTNVLLSWQNNTYTVAQLQDLGNIYRNLQTAYNIYQKHGDDDTWHFLGSTTSDVTSFTFNYGTDTWDDFKVTATNASGESWNPPTVVVNFQPFVASISGATDLCLNDFCQYHATVTHGSSHYTFQWSRSNDNGTTWQNLGTDGTQNILTTSTSTTFLLKVIVTDTWGVTSTATNTILVHSDCQGNKISAGSFHNPSNFYLKNNYPNPFSSITQIEYSIPGTGYASMEIYNPIGQKIRTVQLSQTSGQHTMTIDCAGLSNGMYKVILRSSNDNGALFQESIWINVIK